MYSPFNLDLDDKYMKALKNIMDNCIIFNGKGVAAVSSYGGAKGVIATGLT